MNLKDCHNFADFRKLAKKKLPSPIFHYIDGAADDEVTYARNTSDGWIISGTKMTNTGPFLWNGSSKIQIFTEICYTLCRRLLRPADNIFLKNGCGSQKFPISAFQNHLQTKFNLHIFIRQSQFISAISI